MINESLFTDYLWMMISVLILGLFIYVFSKKQVSRLTPSTPISLTVEIKSTVFQEVSTPSSPARSSPKNL